MFSQDSRFLFFNLRFLLLEHLRWKMSWLVRWPSMPFVSPSALAMSSYRRLSRKNSACLGTRNLQRFHKWCQLCHGYATISPDDYLCNRFLTSMMFVLEGYWKASQTGHTLGSCCQARATLLGHGFRRWRVTSMSVIFESLNLWMESWSPFVGWLDGFGWHFL